MFSSPAEKQFTEKQVKERLKKIEKIRAMGIEPYGGRFLCTHSLSQAKEQFAEGLLVKVAGRIMAFREHGKAIFLDIQDSTEKIQLYIKKDNVEEKEFLLCENLDIGDIIGTEGELFLTRKGEKTVKVRRLFLLSKSLRPLPEKWHGLKDVEIRYRRRCLDLIANPETKKTFFTRARIIREIRRFLEERGFLEVETPMLQHLAGGARARPFITYYNALNCNVYLRIAPELYLKRLLVGGLEKIYELNRNFRNEGISTVHNPEFTMLEVYQAYADYTDMMNLLKEMIIHLVRSIHSKETIYWAGKEIDFGGEWKKASFYTLLREKTGVDFQDRNLDLEKVLKGLGIASEEKEKGEMLNKVFDKLVRPELISPTFVLDYPAFLCPLAKRKKGDTEVSERFELFIGGQELANAYSELNDPLEQRQRFMKQGGEIDEDFLFSLEQGMPPAGGLGLGVDRLVMLLSGHTSIREVVFFPQLKPRDDSSKGKGNL
ncbi:MAG: lysine--tRNA ligase [Candidatus Omnitrophota bacterium]|nr:MAG: lysine--tRNA ligase [Candidatus Omnitrophota bacterium]